MNYYLKKPLFVKMSKANKSMTFFLVLGVYDYKLIEMLKI
jgi:hypothetical protein